MRKIALFGAMLTALVIPEAAGASLFGPRYLICNTGRAAEVAHPRQRPASCTMLRPDAAFSEGARLSRLRWTSWGGKTARATGFTLGFRLPPNPVAVRVVADRPRRDACGTDIVLYTRVKLFTKYGKGTIYPQYCYGDD